jgi:YfiR/HmsC-like
MKDTFLSRTLLCFALLFSGCLSADDGSLEYKIKAGYLYNFTKFITWPELKSPSFNLCLLGNDPFGVVIAPIEKKSAFSLPIRVIRLDELVNSNLATLCHILYISGASNKKAFFEKMMASPQNIGTLVVGEGDAFAADGGMIGFVNRNGKIKLQINLLSVKRTGLKISAKLLEIAEIIKDESHD